MSKPRGAIALNQNGAGRTLTDLAECRIDLTTIRADLRCCCRSFGYLAAAMKARVPRVDLNGAAAGEVSLEEASHARESLSDAFSLWSGLMAPVWCSRLARGDKVQLVKGVLAGIKAVFTDTARNGRVEVLMGGSGPRCRKETSRGSEIALRFWTPFGCWRRLHLKSQRYFRCYFAAIRHVEHVGPVMLRKNSK
jgi:hypothetical protein